MMSQEQELRRWSNFMSIWHTPVPEIGRTPRVAIWKKNKATLWHYPAVKRKYAVPLFLVYSLVNQPYILDLAPGSSMIESYVQNGFDVYLLDFGIPGYEDKDITLTNYIIGYIQKGVRRALRHSGAEEVTLIGYCLGGTLAAVYTSIAEEPIRNLILSVTPLDFSIVPVLDNWVAALQEEDTLIKEFIELYGILPARMMEASMRVVTSPVYGSPYLSLLARGYDDAYVARWRRFNQWTKDHIPFAGAALLQIIQNFGRDNKLMNGGLVIEGKPVHLASIRANLLVICSSYDRLVPPEQSRPIMDMAASTDKTFRVNTGGHVMFTTKDGLSEDLADWLPERSKPIRSEGKR